MTNLIDAAHLALAALERTVHATEQDRAAAAAALRDALAAQPARAGGDAPFTRAELLEIKRAIADFEDCGETDVPNDLLMRAAQAGYLECSRYNVLNSAQDDLDAALAVSRPDDQPRPMMGRLLCTSDPEAHRQAIADYESDLSIAAPAAVERDAQGVECHGLDTPERVCFYEQDFYVLSNFSSFRVTFDGQTFDTSEAAYHYQRFTAGEDRRGVQYASSAHEAFRYAQAHKSRQRPDWDAVKVGIMRDILRAKVQQHEYVRRKLLATGERELVENSWRDDFWGWGPNRDGQNLLGRLWMEIRAELRGIGSGKEGGDGR